MERNSSHPDDEGQLTGLVQFLEISAELEQQYKAYLEEIKDLSPGLFSDKRKREDMYNDIVGELLATKLSSYPTTIQEDLALLSRSALSARYRMAIQVRLGEKLLVEEGLNLIYGSPNDDNDASKSYKKLKE